MDNTMAQTTAEEIYSQVIKLLPLSERLKLATLILDDVSLQVVPDQNAREKEPERDTKRLKVLREIKHVLAEHKRELHEEFHVQSIGIFGSYVRGDQTPQSDIDILVDFDEPVGWEIVDLQEYLETILGVKVDLVTKGANETHRDPVTIIAEWVDEVRQRRQWQQGWADLRAQVQQDGGFQPAATADEIVAMTRRSRQEIFEAEYAHLYR